MKCRSVGILAAVVLFMSVSPVMAVIEFKDGLTHDIDYQINDDVWVDYESPGLETTLNILDGAGVPFPYYTLEGCEDSIINILGGSLWDLWAHDSSQFTVSGGWMYRLAANESSQVTVSGGWMHELYTYGSSQADVSGGWIDMILVAYDSSQVDVSNGWIGDLVAYGSQVNVSGGSMSNLFAYDSSQVGVSSGTIRKSLYAHGSSQVTVSGGLVGRELLISEKAVLTLHGWDFAVDGAPVGYSELYSIFGGNYSGEPYRQLTGTLLNADPINSQFKIGYNGKIVLVPEPATLLLLGLGGLALLRKRKIVLS